MKCLLVIDRQEDYVGESRNIRMYPYNANELELVGVDGNYCVGSSAIDGIAKQYKILFNESLIGIGNYGKFQKMKDNLQKMGVVFTF